MNDFCVFILTNGRPKKVKTYNSLRKCGYTGAIYIVIDDEDKSKDEYYEKFGEDVIEFSKSEMARKFDTGDNFSDMRAIVYARNACFDIAKKLGYKYFIQLDDDYTTFAYKFDTERRYRQRRIYKLDKVFTELLEYYKSINALSVAMAQNGDFIGGKNSGVARDIGTKRKAMNTFICSTDREFKFVGRINEDVNTYVNLGNRGFLFLTILLVAINQTATQKNKGGMTELYLDSGTYLKSFYSVMYNPSSVKIAEMGDKHKRIHHQVSWNNAVPKIIREENKRIN